MFTMTEKAIDTEVIEEQKYEEDIMKQAERKEFLKNKLQKYQMDIYKKKEKEQMVEQNIR